MIYVFLFSLVCFCLSCFGASIVFFVKRGGALIDAFLHAFASGVMIASGIFSLIIPAITYCEQLEVFDYIILPICFVSAGILYYVMEKITNKNKTDNINIKMLKTGIALHNIPEGICVGISFAQASVMQTDASFLSAILIAIGIGIQNIPEGSSVSFPLYSLGYSKKKSFFSSVMVAFVEVPFAIIAYFMGLNFVAILPYMLSFAAAAMISTACLDLMPEAVSKNRKWAMISFFIGFIIMMTFDLALG